MRRSATTGDAFPEVAIHYLESLSKHRDYTAVVNYYQKNRSEIDELGGVEAGTIFRLAAMAYASLNNCSLALRTARLAQKKATHQGDSILLAEIFISIAGILVQMGEHKEAEKAYRDAESIFRRNDHLEGQSRALNLLSGLFFKQNDFKNSMEALTDALAIARKLNDMQKTAYILGNVGRLYTFLGNFPEAVNHLQLNIDLSTELGDWLEVGRASLSLAYAQMQRGEFQAAEDNLEKGRSQIAQQESNRDKAIYLTYHGELYRRTGRLTESQEALKEALALAGKTVQNSSLGVGQCGSWQNFILYRRTSQPPAGLLPKP